MAQGSEFPLGKPPSFLPIRDYIFHCGSSGPSCSKWIIPQAPIHTASLVVWGLPANERRGGEGGAGVKKSREGGDRHRPYEVLISVVEQRVSNMARGALCLVLLTSPFLHVLPLIPRGVVSGSLYVDPLTLIGLS